MQLDEYVDRLRAEVGAAADAAGDDVRDAAERLVAPLDAAVRLVLLEALAAATEEITLDLAPGSVHLRLRGRDPDFVVTPAGPDAPYEEAQPPARAEPVRADTDGGPVARVNFRPPEGLKARIEQAAAGEGLSVNTWLVRVVSATLDPPPEPPPRRSGATRTGWFG